MLVVAAALVVAGIAKGAIGVGLSQVAIGLMLFVLPLGESIAIVTIPSIASNVWLAFHGGRFVPLLRRFGTMIAVAVVAVAATATVFGKLGAPGTAGWFGLLLAVYAVVTLLAWRPKLPPAAETWANPLVGLLSGAVAGLSGMASIPFLPYMQSLDLPKDDLVQTPGFMFLFTIAALALSLVQEGLSDRTNLMGGLAAIVPPSPACWSARRSATRFRPKRFAPSSWSACWGSACTWRSTCCKGDCHD